MFRIKDPSSSQNPIKNSENVQRAKTYRRSYKNLFQKDKKLFSLLDINDKVTNSRGTSLPFQFKRLSPKELDALFNQTITTSRSIQRKKSLTIETTQDEFRRQNSSSCLGVKKSIHTETRTFPYSRNDKWKPEYFVNYENLLHNPKLITEEASNNKWASRLPMLSLKEIKDKSYSSDIFFIKSHSKYPDNKVVKAPYPNHMESDIFNIQDNEVSRSKSGERYLFKPNKIESYTASRESNSNWSPKNTMPTLLNYTSTNWSLLNPANKSNSKTKEEIVNEYKLQNVNNNPMKRQKGFCEFIDLCRVGAPNPNKTYLESMSKTQECFRKRSDICATYDDIHHMYKDICAKPFVKPKIE